MRGVHASEVEALIGSTLAVRVAGDGVALGVTHMGWCCFRERVSNVRYIVWCWVYECRTMFYYMVVVLRTDIDIVMWVANANMVIWCRTDSMGKVIVQPRAGV